MCADIVTNVSRSAACAIVDRGEAFKSPTLVRPAADDARFLHPVSAPLSASWTLDEQVLHRPRRQRAGARVHLFRGRAGAPRVPCALERFFGLLQRRSTLEKNKKPRTGECGARTNALCGIAI